MRLAVEDVGRFDDDEDILVVLTKLVVHLLQEGGFGIMPHVNRTRVVVETESLESPEMQYLSPAPR